MRAHSRGTIGPSFAAVDPRCWSRGRRERRVPARTHGPRARVESTGVGPQVRPGNPGVPRADGLRLIRALPGETWLCCHRPRKRNCVCAKTPATRASGLHDFAVRDAACSSRAPLASTASRLNVRDDRDTPLSEEAGRAVCTRELGETGRGIFSL